MTTWKPIDSIVDHLHSLGYTGPLKAGVLRWGKNQHMWASWHYTIDCQFLVVGDWHSDEVEKFYQSDKTISAASLRSAHKTLMESRQQALAKQHHRAAQEAVAYWIGLSTEGHSPYLERKRVEDPGYGRYDQADVVYSVRNAEGDIYSWQRISSDGRKFICPDSAVKGHFVLIGKHVQHSTGHVIICEGVATALTIHNITGYPVVACLFASNMEPVAGEIVNNFDRVKLVYCADDDWKTTKPNGQPFNPGMEAAQKAVEYHGGLIIAPTFDDDDRGDKDTDFNDMLLLQGHSAVFDLLKSRLEPRAKHLALYEAQQEINKLPVDKAPEDIEEHDLAMKILSETEIRTDSINNLYNFSDYNNTWKLITTADMEAYVAKNMPNSYPMAKLNNVVKRIFTHSKISESYVGEINDSKFVPNQGLSNYEIPLANGIYDTYSRTLRPKIKEDFSTFFFPYALTDEPVCPAWDYFIESWFELDPERDEKRAMLQEYMGYSLLFNNVQYKKGLYIYGPKNTGKSVIMKTLMGVIGNELVSQVDIADMSQRFSAWAMYGKLLNISAETNISSMRDAAKIKKLIGNGDPVMIERKNKDPFVDILRCKHVIAGNTLPQVPDDSSGAIAERLLILLMSRQFQSHQRRYDQEKALSVFEERQGIFNWMVKGAERLVGNHGAWTIVPSSEMMIDRMSIMSNPVTMFISEFMHPCEEHMSSSVADAWEFFRAKTGNRMMIGEFMQAMIDSGLRVERRKSAFSSAMSWKVVGMRLTEDS